MAWVDGEIGSQESEGMLPLLPSETPPPHKSVFVGDLRLADFKQLLATKGIQIEILFLSFGFLHGCISGKGLTYKTCTHHNCDMIGLLAVQAEFAGGILRCGDAFAVRKVGFCNS